MTQKGFIIPVIALLFAAIVGSLLLFFTHQAKSKSVTTLSASPSITSKPNIEHNKPPEKQPSNSPAPKLTSSQSRVEIKGDLTCIDQTKAALNLLQEKAIEHFETINKHIDIIQCVDKGSGIIPQQEPTTYQVGLATRNAGIIWYAGTIAHDSCHARLYNDYLENNPQVIEIPSSVYSGKDAEKQCLDVQYDALEKIGADENTLNYINDVLNTEYWNNQDRWW